MGIRRKAPEIDAATIINGFCERSLRFKSNNRVYPNIYLGRWEADILEVTKAGYIYEYEVKVSRRDFKIDAEKAERHWYGTGRKKYDVLRRGERVNYFSFIVPEGLIQPEEVPEWAGLIYARGYDNKVLIGWERDEDGIEDPNRPIFDEHISVNFATVKDPEKIRANKITDQEIDEINKKLYFRYHKLRCQLVGQKLVTPFGIT